MRIIVNITTSVVPRLIILAIFVTVLIGVIAYARGYRINMQDGTVTSTGIISVNSSPQPAKVYINGQLKGATDINLTMPFGQYAIEVKKEGYTDWKKNVALKGETVMSFNAHLFPKNPSLTPLTNLGIIKAIPLGNTEKIVIISQNGDVTKDGIYMFEAGKRSLSIFPPLTVLLYKSTFPIDVDLNNISFEFDSQYQQAVMTVKSADGIEIDYLISLENENTELIDVTPTKDNVLTRWHEERNTEMQKVIETLPKKIRPLALKSFIVVSLSPDEKKLMYVASENLTLPRVIIPPLIGANQTAEIRDLEKGSVYIYDKKEDKNYKVPAEIDPKFLTQKTSIVPASDESLTPTVDTMYQARPEIVDMIQKNVLWYPTSNYIAVKEPSQISLMEYDGENKQVVYSGPFEPSFFAISPDWNLIVIINLNSNSNKLGDLYSIGIK